MLNSRSTLVTAAPLRGHPFSRSYGVNLPSSLTRVLSNTLVSSTCLPVSVCGTVSIPISLEDFLDETHPDLLCSEERRLSPSFRYACGFSYRPGKKDHAHNQRSRSKLAPCPSITRKTGSGISTGCPSPTPFGLGLGPTNLQRTSLPEETLDFRWTGFSPVLSLLMLAFSLVCSPPGLALRLRPAHNAPLPLPLREVHRFGGWLEPPYIIGADLHSTSKLLRTL